MRHSTGRPPGVTRTLVQAAALLLAPLASRIRPYLLAHEQRTHRRALLLALDGIDVGPQVIHGHRIGTRVAVAA